MSFKILLISTLSTFLFTQCYVPQQVMLTGRSASTIDSIQIMRPLAMIDWLNTGNSEVDSSTKLSVKMEENIMDIVEQIIPQRIGISYFKPKTNEYKLIDSCLLLVRNKIIISGELYISIPTELREIMTRENVSHLLYIQAEGYQRTLENYQAEKRAAIASMFLQVGTDDNYEEVLAPVQSKVIYTGIIIDRARNNVTFYNEHIEKGKTATTKESVETALIQLFNGYFYKYKKGVFQDIKN